MENLQNKTAFITGGSKGIGYGVAEKLMEAGVNVIITSRSQQSVNKAVDQLDKLGHPGKCIGVEADVRDLNSQQRAMDLAKQEFGGVDIVIANAGVGHFAPIQELTPEQWQETLDINLTGVFNTVKATLPSLIESKGYLITIASLAGTNFFAKGSAYNASKFGLVGFTQAVMLDVRQEGVKVTTIMPGSVATHFNGNTPDEDDAWKIQIEDLGQLVVDLLRMPARTLPSKVEVRPSQTSKG
ncbi:NAD(P)-dependent dehydrogenase (short-subunit alcohol dehydrogenase family) [Lewinella aquimaris]|uniref:NAD(P)-dependent dehydrogenase (Short-subunit alcohol dehydrogenase family) n=1 Tax=Neolewinella aquimaris TaxID=1835722 RepID=A0A840DWR4_9BACT|nr:SDR family oxidoreductase [Neolewinella aquimaris]MBB4077644.1 NAD(P)-dependent dehydrogenase (short-subunit alcohol dehydrogenase family) [Neolewinella aquimaris]